ncbi:hypothetical protein LOC51_43295 [Rubrivivax sp. JA1024]|nr:hypothetical protein [Rubrivivax sp. JA1024]
MDKAKAVIATAHKIARLIYRLLSKGQEYTDQGQAYYERRYRQRVLHNLQRKALQLGMALVPVTPDSDTVQKTPPVSITCGDFLERPHRGARTLISLCFSVAQGAS